MLVAKKMPLIFLEAFSYYLNFIRKN